MGPEGDTSNESGWCGVLWAEGGCDILPGRGTPRFDNGRTMTD
jgi:hypothetical protein